MVRPATVWERPSVVHQLVVRNLTLALMKHCPRSLEVVPGPLTVWPFDEQLIQPDVIIVKRASLAALPVLIAEVIDDRSRDLDRQVKPTVYAKAGVEHYWHVDPRIPEFVAYRLVGDGYREVVTARGEERVGFDAPVLVEICPARLARA